MPAAVEMAHAGGEVDAGRVDARLGKRLESRADGEELAAYRAHPGVGLAGIHQAADEVRPQQHVRVQRKHPLAVAGPDRPVLSVGKSYIPIISEDPDPLSELPEDLQSAIGGSVVEHHDIQRHPLLPEDGFEATADITTAIEGDDGDANGSVGHWFVNFRYNQKTPQPPVPTTLKSHRRIGRSCLESV